MALFIELARDMDGSYFGHVCYELLIKAWFISRRD